MPFDPIYSPDADAYLRALPDNLQKRVAKEIRRLADDPVQASAPPSGPLWPMRQMFFFEIAEKDEFRTFVAICRYHADEQHISILAIQETFSQGPDSGPH